VGTPHGGARMLTLRCQLSGIDHRLLVEDTHSTKVVREAPK
jgi:hypothetical protein